MKKQVSLLTSSLLAALFLGSQAYAENPTPPASTATPAVTATAPADTMKTSPKPVKKAHHLKKVQKKKLSKKHKKMAHKKTMKPMHKSVKPSTEPQTGARPNTETSAKK